MSLRQQSTLPAAVAAPSPADVEAKSAPMFDMVTTKTPHYSDVHATSTNISCNEFLTGRRIQDVSDEFFFPGRKDITAPERKTWKLLLTATEIQLCVRWIASQINKKFAGQKIVLTGILKGVFIFMSDLCKHLTIPYTVNFLEASSYCGQKQKDDVRLATALRAERFQDRKIVLLDELFDHGKTLDTITRKLMCGLNIPRSDIFTCTLYKKIKETKYPAPDLVAFDQFPDVWLVGYGLDAEGTKRGWPHVYGVPKPEGFKRCAVDKILDRTPEGEVLFRAARRTFRTKLTEIAGSF